MNDRELREARDLLEAHHSLRWNIARNSDRAFGMYAIDARETTTQPHFPAPMARQLLHVALALVHTRLRELGVTPDKGFDKLEGDCFECGGDGKRAMG